MSLPNPLLKRIHTEDNIYIYSGKTNRIFLVTDATSDVLEFYGRRSKEEIVGKLREQHTLSALEDGLGILDRLNQQHGMFSPGEYETRIKRMTEGEVETELSQGIQTICLEVTEACNLRCKYCTYSGGYSRRRTHGTRHMDWPTAKAAIDLLNARHRGTEEGSSNVGFYGGEPLLRFDFIKRCVEYAESLEWDTPSGVSFNMTTNGTLLTDDVIEFILEHNVTPTISLDGPQSEHDCNRIFSNGQGSFARVFENVERLNARMLQDGRQFSPLFNCVVSPGSDLIKLNEFFFKNACVGLITELLVGFVNPGHRTFFQECPEHPRRQQQWEALSQAYCDAHLRSFDPHAPENVFTRQLFERDYLDLYKRHVCTTVHYEAHLTRMCFPGKRRPFVTTDGEIHVCERINDSLPIGDVWNGFDVPRITQLWNQFAKLADMEDCRTCWAVRLCPLCFTQVVADGEFSSELKTSECESIRNHYVRTLREYCRMQELNPGAFEYMKDCKVM
jgi:uncharacterized protein